MNNKWRFDEREINYVREVLDSGFTSSTSGSMCKRFEEAYAQKTGAAFCIVSNSGTSTMHSCLAAAGVGPGDEVIVPALTVISTANVVIHQNAVPIFADIDPDTFNIDPKDIERRITPRTKAIIPVALYGLCPDMDAIMAIAKKHDLFVIVDAAEAHMAEYKGVNVAQLGHATSFSLENSKHITCGDGGCVTTNDERIAVGVRKHGSQGYKAMTSGDGRIRLNKDTLQDPGYKRHDSLGWNYRLPEVAAAVALAQLEKIDFFVGLRIMIAGMYQRVLDETHCDFLVPQKTPKGYKNTYYTWVVKFDEKKAGCTWQEFRHKYIEFGGDGIYAAWSPVYLEPLYTEYNFYNKGWPNTDKNYDGKVEYKEGLCPVVERVQPTLMQFVNNYSGEEEARPKVEALRMAIEFFQKKKHGTQQHGAGADAKTHAGHAHKDHKGV